MKRIKETVFFLGGGELKYFIIVPNCWRIERKGNIKQWRPMVLILEGSSEHVAQAGRKIGLFGIKKSELSPLFI